MLFRGSQKKQYRKNKGTISLPGKYSTGRNLAPRSFGIDLPERVAFCIPRWKVSKGSLTIEAAFALPLFFLTIVSLIGLMGIYASYAKEMVSLQQKAENIAVIQVYAKNESSTPVKLYASVKTEMDFLPFEAGYVKASVAAYVLPWTGRSDYSSLEEANSTDGQLYYVSDYKSVYHTSSCCSYLALQITAVNESNIQHMKNENGDHYSACERCVGSGKTGSIVYVTENGEHFHNSAECSGLKRSVHLVDASEVAGLHMCSRCSKSEVQS